VILENRSIYAVDVGTTRNGRAGGPAFAWACVGKAPLGNGVACSSAIEQLAVEIERDLLAGRSVALGFESPLFIPVPADPTRLSSGREGDGARSWSAPAGLAVTTLGVHQSAWILRRLSQQLSGAVRFTLDYHLWPPKDRTPTLLLWEAFVSGKAHREHARDAASAATYFLANEGDLEAVAIGRSETPISLIGAVALWSGWSRDFDLLHTGTLVLRPPVSFEGELLPCNPAPPADGFAAR
jgi:hypothetical protein